jgi:hypothetical protein
VCGCGCVCVCVTEMIIMIILQALQFYSQLFLISFVRKIFLCVIMPMSSADSVGKFLLVISNSGISTAVFLYLLLTKGRYLIYL